MPGFHTFTISSARPVPLRGQARVPGDKSIAIRALLLALLADGVSTLHGITVSDDITAALRVVQALGGQISLGSPGLQVKGRGLHAVIPPQVPLDCGGSGTVARLLTGIVAGRERGPFIITGNSQLSRRPMDRVITPLRQMGATVEGWQLHPGGSHFLPLVFSPGELRGVTYTQVQASAQVKSAILLAGLRASGVTTVFEPVSTRDHTERMLKAFGVGVKRDGQTLSVERVEGIGAAEIHVPGDVSAAAFLVVAALLVPGSEIRVEGVCLGEGRTGYLRVLKRMGAQLHWAITGEEPEVVGTITACYSPTLKAVEVEASEIPQLIDELPILAVAAIYARGKTKFLSVGELRFKETDRLEAILNLLNEAGAKAQVDGDDLVVTGKKPSFPWIFDAQADHRMGMAALVLSLRSPGICMNPGEAKSFPDFHRTLGLLQHAGAAAGRKRP